MPIPLSSIKGLMINKEPSQVTAGFHEPPSILAHNRAIDVQGAKKIGMNREKLAKRIYEFYEYPNKWEIGGVGKIRRIYLNLADAIIANEADIIEVKE